MILKGSQRGGGEQLAAHLLNEQDNDHVTLLELRGFVSEDLHGALCEAHAISKGTRCRQFMFSLSINPPKGADCSIEALIDAANRAGELLGLQDQPRAIAVHEKEGRRHIHAVWSRIDIAEMKAVELPFFKNKLAGLSKELYLEHGWELPDGHRENGWKNPLNFTLAEWQQTKRLGLDPREVKALFGDAWKRSDGVRAFKGALEDRGYFLARGDRRGFVAVDVQGEVFSVSRMVGVKAKDLEARLGSPDGLSSVSEVTQENERRMSQRMREMLREGRRNQREALAPLLDEHRAIVAEQRQEREIMKRAQDARLRLETAQRQSRFRGGVRGLWDVLTGRAAQLRRENELQALQGFERDRDQRERLFEAQLRERSELQKRIEEMRQEQRSERMKTARQISFLFGLDTQQYRPALELRHARERSFDFH